MQKSTVTQIIEEFNLVFKGSARAFIRDGVLSITIGSKTLRMVVSVPMGWQD